VTGGDAYFEVNQINPLVAIQATATGTFNAQYIYGTLSSDVALTNVAQDVTVVTTRTANGLSQTSGVFSLTAGITYDLNASLAIVGNGNFFFFFNWVDSVTNAVIGNCAGGEAVSVNFTTGALEGGTTPARVIYTPATNQTVKLRITNSSTSGSVDSDYSAITITQINPTFSLTYISTLSTVGGVDVGGTLKVGAQALFSTISTINTVDVGTNLRVGNQALVSSLSTVSAVDVGGNLTVNGYTQVQEIIEVLPSTLIAAPSNSTMTLSWLNGAIYQVSSISSYMTVRINDVPTTNNRAMTLTFLLSQGGAAAYLISSLFINTVATTIKWPAATQPTPTVARTEIETFTLFRIQNNWTVIGQLNSFG
jgi:hypothetical protein